MLLLSYLVQSLWLPFTRHILFSSITLAFGLPQGVALSYTSFLVTGLICYGIGIFFLGDIIPLLREKILWTQLFVINKYLAGGILAFSSPFHLCRSLSRQFLARLYGYRSGEFSLS